MQGPPRSAPLATAPLAAISLAALAVLLGSGSATAAEPARTLDQRLDEGEVISTFTDVAGSEFPRVVVQAVIEVPPEQVWALLDRCGDYEKTMKRTLSSVEVFRKKGPKGTTVRCDITIDLPAPVKNLRSVSDALHVVEPGVRWSRKWTLVEGDFDKNDGGWTLTPFRGSRGRTLVRYELHAEPILKVPTGIQNFIQRKSIPRLFAHLREQAAKTTVP